MPPAARLLQVTPFTPNTPHHPQASSIAESSAAGTAASASGAGHGPPAQLSKEERRLKQRCMSLWSKVHLHKVAHHFRRNVSDE